MHYILAREREKNLRTCELSVIGNIIGGWREERRAGGTRSDQLWLTDSYLHFKQVMINPFPSTTHLLLREQESPHPTISTHPPLYQDSGAEGEASADLVKECGCWLGGQGVAGGSASDDSSHWSPVCPVCALCWHKLCRDRSTAPLNWVFCFSSSKYQMFKLHFYIF